MFTAIDRFNSWYDKQQDPWRFLIFMGLMFVSVFALHLGLVVKNLPMMAVGLITTSVVVVIAVVRASGHRGILHRKVGYAIMGVWTFVVLATMVFFL